MPEYIKRLRELVGPDELLQVPSVSVALRDGVGRILLARHVEGDQWVLPGGAIEPGELPADAAVREMLEETGIAVRLTRLVGVFGGPEFIVHYRNGHRTSYVMIVFEATAEDHAGQPDGAEVLEVNFMSPHRCAPIPPRSHGVGVIGSLWQVSVGIPQGCVAATINGAVLAYAATPAVRRAYMR